MDEKDKVRTRERAVHSTRQLSVMLENAAVVAGHYIFWPEERKEVSVPVWTAGDTSTYTHILFLDVRGEVFLKRHTCNFSRERPQMSAEKLAKW